MLVALLKSLIIRRHLRKYFSTTSHKDTAFLSLFLPAASFFPVPSITVALQFPVEWKEKQQTRHSTPSLAGAALIMEGAFVKAIF